MKKQKHKRQIAAPMLAGTPVQLGGRDYVMPSLNAVDARLYWDRIEQESKKGNLLLDLNLTVTLVAACLRRNYPEATEELVAPHVDFDNMVALSSAVFGRGSFRAWLESQKAQAAEGNEPAPQPMPAAGTGAPSTPA